MICCSCQQHPCYVLTLFRRRFGPLLFTLCGPTMQPSRMICAHAISHHLYADDTQLYVSFASRDSTLALNGLQSSLVSVHSWILMNKPKLNPYVTECRRSRLVSLDMVKQIFNDQTSKVQLFTEFITDILYVHDVSSLYNIRQKDKTNDRGKRNTEEKKRQQ